jgi:hypothetical protein
MRHLYSAPTPGFHTLAFVETAGRNVSYFNSAQLFTVEAKSYRNC